jgi:hypothetical protein
MVQEPELAMGFAEWWHYRDVPRPVDPPRLVLDLAAGTLNGLGFGEPSAKALALLGPPASYAEAQRGQLFYPEWGLKVELDEDRLDAFGVVLDLEQTIDFRPVKALTRPYPGELVLAAGQPPCRMAEVREAQVRAHHGEPDDEERFEDGELDLRYEGKLLALSFEFNPAGALAYVQVDNLQD